MGRPEPTTPWPPVGRRRPRGANHGRKRCYRVARNRARREGRRGVGASRSIEEAGEPSRGTPWTILIGTIDAMSIYETPSGRLSSDAPLFRRPGNRKRPPASMNLPGGAQQRTAQTTGAKQSRARSLVVFQFLDVGLQFLPSGPAAEVELKHLQG